MHLPGMKVPAEVRFRGAAEFMDHLDNGVWTAARRAFEGKGGKGLSGRGGYRGGVAPVGSALKFGELLYHAEEYLRKATGVWEDFEPFISAQQRASCVGGALADTAGGASRAPAKKVRRAKPP